MKRNKCFTVLFWVHVTGNLEILLPFHYLGLKGLDMFIFPPNQRRITIKKTSLTFSVIHRRHFEETGYVIIRMLAWMLTMRSRAHNYDALPRQLKCFDYA